jgi:hypothetical protein
VSEHRRNMIEFTCLADESCSPIYVSLSLTLAITLQVTECTLNHGSTFEISTGSLPLFPIISDMN